MVVTAAVGRVRRVAGPLVEIVDLGDVAVFDLVEVGDTRLAGEVVAIEGGLVTAQLFEDTSGLAPGAAVSASGSPLAARLGPGLLGGVFDGILRPLEASNPWLRPGARRSSTPETFRFRPGVAVGDELGPGSPLGVAVGAVGVDEAVVVPPGVQGHIEWIGAEADVGVDDVIATIDGHDLYVHHRWPVRVPRPARRRLDAAVPLVTGQRVLDLLYPIAKGSTSAVVGGFGTGKTMLLQQVAKWCDADVIIYVGCGERGNELADVIDELQALEDPRTGRRLVERTVIIANTSNMPVMAREASIYTGMTVAEHFRDQGLDAVLIADSTSRWAEALREFASRTGELPAEEGYPAGLGSALAAFYERAGRVETLSGATGSVSVIAAVSPPGGDTTEPVSAHTQRFVRALWDLDRDLAYARHYPAVSWRASFSRDTTDLGSWHARNGDTAWPARRARLQSLLAEADHLESVGELVGTAALPGRERIVLLTARLRARGRPPAERAVRERRLVRPGQGGGDRRSRPGRARPGPVAHRPGSPGDDRRDHRLRSDPPGRPRARPGRRGRRRRTARPGPAGTGAVVVTGVAPLEHHDLRRVQGPLVVVGDARGVGWNEFAMVQLPDGSTRHGVVLDVDDDLAVVQVMEGTEGITPAQTTVAFTGSPVRIPVGDGWLGRACNGRGEPLDGGPPVAGDELVDVHGVPMNPVARETPQDPVLTGVSMIDALTTLVRGQKLPIFSVGGLPHLELATQIAAQAHAGDEDFAVVFAGIGITHADAAQVRDTLEARAAAGQIVVLLNTAADPVVERILTPRLALTVAEDLAFRGGRHVLVVMADMTSYCEAVRQVGAASGEIPGRRGYPGYLYSDLASLYERCGRLRGRAGSITEVPVLTMPAGDLTHPVPDLTGYITEGQVVLSADRHARGRLPADRSLVVALPAHAPGRRSRSHARRPPGSRCSGAVVVGPLARRGRAGRSARGGRAVGDRARVPGLRRRVRPGAGPAGRREPPARGHPGPRLGGAVRAPTTRADHARRGRARPALPAGTATGGGGDRCLVDRPRVERDGCGSPGAWRWPGAPPSCSSRRCSCCGESSAACRSSWHAPSRSGARRPPRPTGGTLAPTWPVVPTTAGGRLARLRQRTCGSAG